MSTLESILTIVNICPNVCFPFIFLPGVNNYLSLALLLFSYFKTEWTVSELYGEKKGSITIWPAFDLHSLPIPRHVHFRGGLPDF